MERMTFCSYSNGNWTTSHDEKETMSNSDFKSQHETIFSDPNHPLSLHSTNHTTPSHSRPSSPSRCRPTDFKYDLSGIGYVVELPGQKSTQSTLQNSGEQSQHIPVDRNITLHAVGGSPYDLMPPGTSHFDNNSTGTIYKDTHLPSGINDALSPSSSQYSTDVGRKPTGSPSFNSDDEFSGSDTSDDDDLDLERAADGLLSQWFGININGLARPDRIIDALENVKKQCADILKEEGNYLPDNQEENEHQNIQNTQPGSYNDGNHAAGITCPNFDVCGTFERNGKKKLSQSTPQSGSSSGPRSKVRGPYTKRRFVGEFSCPYRKRNPLRFNVREYEMCANKSYPNISSLKKHLTAQHSKSFLFCPRCQETFTVGRERIAHLERCPHPPQQRVNNQHADPEDGFDENVENRLRSRQNDFQIKDWETLYQLLFPDDLVIPDSGILSSNAFFYFYCA
ncbi:hypothetical protein F4775DRAFT_580983 [Biscogniauxia sp. FL1348]|nr:hypothetical protein F4775DRAFT_580983 [Biscogniauxia sp. FL1348]